MDRIDLLESKVKQMIDLVQSLRDENQGLQDRLAAAEARVHEAHEERTVLDRERAEVRTRIEQLLGDIEGLAAERPAAEASENSEPAGAAADGDNPPADPGDGGGRRAGRRSENPVLPGLG